jgi:hypothetical protein
MSFTGIYSETIQANGSVIVGTVTRTGDMGIDAVDTALPVGHSGQLTTRVGDGSGTITLTAGHDIVTGDVDVHWAGGCRYAMAGTVTVNALVVVDDAGSAGDVLPANLTSVVASKPITLDVTFDGDNVILIGCGASQQTSVRFIDGGGDIIAALLLVAGASWGWAEDTAVTNPLAGDAIVTVEVSCGNATSTSNFKLAGLQYAFIGT